MRPFLLALLTLGLPAQAGSRWLYNDSYNEGGSGVYFQEGFAVNECWGAVLEPDQADYPFEITKLRLLVAGAGADGATGLMTLYWHNLATATAPVNGSDEELGEEEAIYLTGSKEYWNDLPIPFDDGQGNVAFQLPEISEGLIGVSGCYDDNSASGLGMANDGDGMSDPALNYLYAGSWAQSKNYGIQGDWIARVCIEGPGVGPDEGCSEEESDTDTDTDTDTDSDTDTDTDTDTDADFFVDGITPDSADEGDPVEVAIFGEGFVEGASAYIGGVRLTGVEVNDASSIRGRTPSSLPPGTHDVEVELPDGSADFLPAAFTVLNSDVVDAEEKKCGCAAGGAAGGGLAVFLGLLGLSRRREGPSVG